MSVGESARDRVGAGDDGQDEQEAPGRVPGTEAENAGEHLHGCDHPEPRPVVAREHGPVGDLAAEESQGRIERGVGGVEPGPALAHEAHGDRDGNGDRNVDPPAQEHVAIVKVKQGFPEVRAPIVNSTEFRA